jgi:uncharacterized DUF497 family protein
MTRRPAFTVYYAAYRDDQFVWSPPKSLATFDERGLSFEVAKIAFRGRMLRRRDTRKDYGEVRYQALGECYGVVLHIVFTPRNHQCRIISVRRANAAETAVYYA